MASLNALCLKIEKNLTQDHFEEIYFLLQNILTAREIECIDNNRLQLFEILKKRNLLSDADISILIEIIEELGLNKLVGQIEIFYGKIPQIKGKIDMNIKVLYKLGQHFNKEDVKNAVYVLEFTPATVEKIRNSQWRMLLEAIDCKKLAVDDPMTFVKTLFNKSIETALNGILKVKEKYQTTCDSNIADRVAEKSNANPLREPRHVNNENMLLMDQLPSLTYAGNDITPVDPKIQPARRYETLDVEKSGSMGTPQEEVQRRGTSDTGQSQIMGTPKVEVEGMDISDDEQLENTQLKTLVSGNKSRAEGLEVENDGRKKIGNNSETEIQSENVDEIEKQTKVLKLSDVESGSEEQFEQTKTAGSGMFEDSVEHRDKFQNGISLIRQLNMDEMTKYYGRTTADTVSSRGEFGIVYKGNRKYHGCDVVVKEMKMSSENYSAFMKEKLLGRVVHPFLVPIFALAEGQIPGAKHEIEYCCIMYPWMQNKDLRNLLDKNSDELAWRVRLRILYQAAEGLRYLHTAVPGYRQQIVHCDVKSANILIDDHFNARLGDCGFSKELQEGRVNVSVSQRPGTLGYGSPDLIDLEMYEPKHDVFSLGVVMLELLTGQQARIPKSKKKKFESDMWKKYSGFSLEILIDDIDDGIWPSEDLDAIFKAVTKAFAEIALSAIRKRLNISAEELCKKLKKLLATCSEDHFKSEDKYKSCLSCLINPRASLSTCDCKPVCTKCMQSYYRNPLHCPKHERFFSPIGESFCMVMVAGNDYRENKKAFAETMVADVQELYDVMTSRYPHYVGMRQKLIEKVIPHEPGKTDSEMKERVKVAFQKSNDKINASILENVTFIFYFTGHSNAKGLWLGNSDPDVLADVLTAEELKNLFGKLPPKKVSKIIPILDCCTASGRNLVGLDVSLDANRFTDDNNETNDDIKCDFEKNFKDILQKSFFETDTRQNIPIWQWSSSSNDQISHSRGEKRYSFFTKSLTQGLKGKTCTKCFLEEDCKICEKYHYGLKDKCFIKLNNLNMYITDHLEMCFQKRWITSKQLPGFKSEHFTDMEFAFSTGKLEIELNIDDEFISKIVVEHLPEDIGELRKTLLDKLKSNRKSQDQIPNELDSSVIQICVPTSHKEWRELKNMDEVMSSWEDMKPKVRIRRDPGDIINGPVVHSDTKRSIVKSILDKLPQFQNVEDCYTCDVNNIPTIKKVDCKRSAFSKTLKEVFKISQDLTKEDYNEDRKLQVRVFETFAVISLLK